MIDKKVLTIQDLSCFGQCSISVFLPILTAFGLEMSIIPTSIFSAHTGAFKDYYECDMINSLIPIAKHLGDNEVSYDLIHIGYMENTYTLQNVITAIEYVRKPNTILVFDPILGDNEKTYKPYDAELVCAMRSFLSNCDYITPNLTEACLLAGMDYSQEINIDLLLKKLEELGPKHIILKGIVRGEKIGIVYRDCLSGNQEEFFNKYYQGFYQGCGDIFAAIICGGIANDVSIGNSIRLATKYIQKSIESTEKAHSYGVRFEKHLSMITHYLK